MTLCEDDAKLTGPVALFLGVETASWKNTDFAQAADWAKGHGITTLFVKVSEVGSKAGDVWYGGWNEWDAIYQELQKNINIIPYAFVYGDQDIQKEISIAVQMLKKYGKYCLDMEGGEWASPTAADRAKQFAQALAPLPGKLWVSCPADPVRNNQLPFLQALSPAVNIYMPMIYSDNLAQAWEGDFSQVNAQACLQPTFDLSQEFGANNLLQIVGQAKSKGIHAISLWEYQFAQKDANLLGQVVSAFTGSQNGGTDVTAQNSKGEVADYVDVSQFEPKESEMECGFFSVALNLYAGEPGKGPKGTPEQVDQWADSHGGINTQGVSIDDMHNLFRQAGLHYWDIDSINPNSDQKHDQAQIKAALAHGYPVIVTIPESGVYDLVIKGNPYSPNWNPQFNHIFTITGVTQDGNYLVHDQAAVQGGILGKLAPQPRRYRADSLHIHWASIVRPGEKPWLPAIPSGDPLSWGAAASSERSTWLSTGQQKQAEDTWNIGVTFVSKVWGANLAANTGIYHDWEQEYMNGRNQGFPITEEESMVNWDNKPIIVQYFSSGTRCEWDGKAHWY